MERESVIQKIIKVVLFLFFSPSFMFKFVNNKKYVQMEQSGGAGGPIFLILFKKFVLGSVHPQSRAQTHQVLEDNLYVPNGEP